MELDHQGRSLSLYSVLGISSDSSIDEIRRAYRKLAMKWHPDRWTRTRAASMLGEANRKFQQIQQAYSVLSDQRKRTLYDAGLFGPDQEEEEEEEEDGFSDFMQEMMSLMGSVRREEKDYSLQELQGMLNEMIQNFESTSPSPSPSSSWWYGQSVLNDSGRTKRARWDENWTRTSAHVPVPGLRMCAASNYSR